MPAPAIRLRRFAAFAVAVLLLLPLFPQPARAASLAQHLIADGPVDVSVLLSAFTYPESAEEVIVGTAEAFPDNLASGVLQDGRPLLLTDPDELSPAVAEELNRLTAQRVILLGGTAAISDQVADELAGLGLDVDRVFGQTRIETAVDVAATAGGSSVQVARAFPAADAADASQAFADSLTAGAFAADTGQPILLTQTETLTPSTAAYLADAGITDVTIIGGPAAVAESVSEAIAELGITVARVQGPTRFDTAAEVAATRGVADPAAVTTIVLTEGQAGDAWISGFTAAGFAATNDAPLLLSNGDDLPAPTAELIQDVAAEGNDVTLVCTPAVTAAACQAAADLLGASVDQVTLDSLGEEPEPEPEPVAETDAPQLIAAAITGGDDVSTTLQLTFDEPIDAIIDATRVFAVSPWFDLDEIARGTAAAVDPADPTQVMVQLDQGGALRDRLVTVYLARAMVRDADGRGNTTDTAALRDVTLQGGVTDGPDLIGIVVDSGATANGDGDETVDFMYDEPIATVGAASNFLVIPAGGPSVGFVAGNAAMLDATTVRATFTFGQLTDAVIADLARAFSGPGAVTDAEGDTSPAAVFGLSNAAATGPGPDLVSAVVDIQAQSVTYRYDEAVTLVNSGEFFLVNVDGTTVGGPAFVIDAQPDGADGITVTFGGSVVHEGVVAAHVRAATVSDAGGGNAARHVAPIIGSYLAGYTSGPDPLSAERRIRTDGVGNPTGIEVVMTFDGPVTTGAADVSVLAANGLSNALSAAACADGDTPETIVCGVASGDPDEQPIADAVAINVTGGVALDSNAPGLGNAPATLPIISS